MPSALRSLGTIDDVTHSILDLPSGRVHELGSSHFDPSSSDLSPNAGGEPRPIAAATKERRLLGVGCRVEPVVTHPAPPQTRTCAMHGTGSPGRAAPTPLQCPGVPWSRVLSSNA